MSSQRPRAIPSALLLLLVAIACSATAGAQADPTNENERLAARGQDLLADVEGDIAEAQRLVADVENADGEQRKVLRRRLSEVRLGALDQLGALVKNVLAQEKAGIDTGALRARLDPTMIQIASRGPEVAQEQFAFMQELRQQAEDDPPADLEVFERQFNRENDWLDTVHRACLEHYQRMEALGLDGGALRGFLEESLTAEADSLTTRLELASEDADTVRTRISETPSDETLQGRLRVAELRIEGTARSLGETVAMMRKLKLPTTRYQQILIQATGDITTDVLDTQVAIGLLQDWADDGREWLVSNGANLIFRLLVFIVLLAFFWILSKLVRRLVRRSVTSSKLNLSQLLQNMVVSFSGQIVFLFGLLIALNQVGLSLGPLLAGLGVVGFIVGFALQDTLGNFASGMMILIYRPFDIGDFVEAAGVSGKVNRMNLVSTTILTFDNQTLVVPNNKIWGDVIRNVTAQRQRRVDLTFGISYSDDIPKAEAVLHEIVGAHPKVLDEPEPNIRVHALGESSVDFIVRPWVETDDYWEVYWDLTREVKMRFDASGISIPFPQRDVHLYQKE